MEESNLASNESTSTSVPTNSMAVPLVESTATTASVDVVNAKGPLVGDGPGAQSPNSADSLIDDEHLSASASEPTSVSKPQRKYERKTKRFVWPDELHRLFVASIFDLGLKHASPKALMPFMATAANSYGLTTEHLKSHLQKYRLNYERSRVEFLEFYDETAQRNQKRRRRSGARGAAPSGGSDHNTMFVFPIRAQATSSGADAGGDAEKAKAPNAEDDEEDEDMDEEDEVDSVNEEASGRSQHKRTASRDSTRATSTLQQASSALYYQQLLQQAHAAAAMASPHQRRSLGENGGHLLPPSRAKSPQHLVELAQQYASNGLPFPTSAPGASMYDSAAAATAAAAAAAATAGGNGGPLTDPQWSILASLLSPHLTAATAAAAAGGHQPRSRSIVDDAFLLDAAEPSDLQMQMHLAMQAQMNLHRQMLGRKVAVSQNAFYGQQQQQLMGDRGGTGHFPPAALPDVHHQHQQQWAASAADHLPPSHAMRLQLLQQQQQQQQQQQHSPYHPHAPRNPTPSFQQQLHGQSFGFPSNAAIAPPVSAQAPPSHAMPLAVSSGPPHTASSSAAAVTTMSSTSAAASSTTASLPPTTTRTTSNTAAAPPPNRLTLTPGLTAMPAPGSTDVPMNPLDIYRWDQMDLQMSLSDEDEEGDLFGFLRS